MLYYNCSWPLFLFLNLRCQEFNIEKLQILEAEKKRIRQEFVRKTKQVDIRRKMSALLPFLVFFFPHKSWNSIVRIVNEMLYDPCYVASTRCSWMRHE